MAKKKARSKKLEPTVSTHHRHKPILRSIPPRPPRKNRHMTGNRTTTSGGPRKNTTCFYYGGKGHDIRSCPEKRNGKGAYPLCSNIGCCVIQCPQWNLEGLAWDAITTNQGPQRKPGQGFNCFKCSDPGHYVRDCPLRKSNKQEKGVDAINLGLGKEKCVSSKCVIQEPTGPNKSLLPGLEALPVTACAECGKIGQGAQSFPPLRQVTCFTRGQTRHYSYNCPAPYCPYCKKHHLPEGYLKNLVACTRCGEKGHQANQCTANYPNREEDHQPGESSMSKVTCFVCEGQDHCPKNCSMSRLLTKAAEIQRLSFQAAIRLVMNGADKSNWYR